jgi:hypothetical protein
VDGPEMLRAPVVLKVPVVFGNVEKSYQPVMVTAPGELTTFFGEIQLTVQNVIISSAAKADTILFRTGKKIIFFIFFFF